MITTMPFEKCKGKLLTELSDDYVLWLLTLPDLRDPLREAIEAEADRRMAASKHQEVP